MKPILKRDSNLASFVRAPHLKFVDRRARQFRVAMQIVRVEDRAHVAQAVPGDGDDLRLGAADQGEPRHRRAGCYFATIVAKP